MAEASAGPDLVKIGSTILGGFSGKDRRKKKKKDEDEEESGLQKLAGSVGALIGDKVKKAEEERKKRIADAKPKASKLGARQGFAP